MNTTPATIWISELRVVGEAAADYSVSESGQGLFSLRRHCPTQREHEAQMALHAKPLARQPLHGLEAARRMDCIGAFLGERRSTTWK